MLVSINTSNAEVKICIGCKVTKNVNMFRITSRGKLEGRCFDCSQQYKREYYDKNKEIIKARVKSYAEQNKDKVIASRKAHSIKNAEKIKQYKKEYQLKNAEKIKAYLAEYNIKNADRLAEAKKTYALNNPDIATNAYKKHYANNRDKIRKRNAEYAKTEMGKAIKRNVKHKRRATKDRGDVTTQQIIDLQRNAKVCYWCGIKLSGIKTHIDHYIPLSKGGEHTLSNLVIACDKCNLSKSSKDPIVFAHGIGKLF